LIFIKFGTPCYWKPNQLSTLKCPDINNTAQVVDEEISVGSFVGLKVMKMGWRLDGVGTG